MEVPAKIMFIFELSFLRLQEAPRLEALVVVEISAKFEIRLYIFNLSILNKLTI